MGATLRILSANLWNGRADAAGFAELAVRTGADVVALQELGHEQAESLAAAFPHGRLDPRDDHFGGGIAIARPGQVERLPLRGRDGFRAELSPSDWPELPAPLEIVSVHMFAPHLAAGRGLLRRRPQLEDLERHLHTSDARPRIVVGDFNSTPVWPLYRRLRRILDDGALEVARRQGERPRRTWAPLPWMPRLLRIDHGFVSGVTLEAFRVFPLPDSDHSAILLDVALGEGAFG